ncbi:MAG: phosphopantothenoylcysteine decarboxylase [Planctomycetota bacterium]
MARILITSGPTRQYIDPVRYISNASSGKMGSCLARAAVNNGHEVVIVSGPVQLDYPEQAELLQVVSTEDLLETCLEQFSRCDGLIGAAAPCDYRPVEVADHKIRKTGETLDLKLEETEDVVARLGAMKNADQWTVGFALETEDARFRALSKLIRKSCDLVVLNGVSAIDSDENSIEIISRAGRIVAQEHGDKQKVAQTVIDTIESQLIRETG